MPKCNKSDFGEVYCFNLSFFEHNKKGNTDFGLVCNNNCTDDKGNPYIIDFKIIVDNFKIDNEEIHPFYNTGLYLMHYETKTTNKSMELLSIMFTSIRYRTI